MVTQCPSCSATLDADRVRSVSGAAGHSDTCPECGCAIDQSIEATASMETTDSVNPQWVTQSPIPNTTFVQQSTEQIDRQLLHFELIRLLGQGGFGTVWLARDTNLGRHVALKLPKDPDARLLHEAQTAARLKHPNIVSVFEVGVEKGHLFIASEFVDGETLKEELQKGRPELHRAVAVIKKIALAAHHAHEHNVVHRDMKPANVIVDETGEPFITDFGIAKSISADETISLDGQIVGTIAYMAPEQAQGQNASTDRRADVYAMGVMLFELLTEYRPFRGNAQGILYQKNHEDPPSPRTLVPLLPRDLETICLKCLARDPDRRYRTALQLAEELERFEQNLPILARPISRAEKLWRWARRNPGIASLSSLLVLSLVCGLIGVTYFWQNALASAKRTEDTLYRAHMNLASSAWVTSDVDAVRSFLSRYESPQYTRLHEFGYRVLRHSTSPVIRTINHGSVIRAVAVSHDGTMLATTGHRDYSLRVWKITTGELIFEQQRLPYQPTALAFSPLDQRLLVGDDTGMLRVWNPVEHDHVAFEMQHGSPIATLCFSPDRRFIASASHDGLVRIWKMSNRQMLSEVQHLNRPVTSVAFAPDGSAVAAVFRTSLSLQGRETGFVSVLKPQTGREVVRSKPVRQLRHVNFGDESNRIVVTSDTGFLYQFHVDSGEINEVRPSLHGTPIGDVTFLPNTKHFVITDGQGHCLKLGHDFNECFKTYTHSNSFGLVDSARNGQTVAVAGGDGRAVLLDTGRMKADNVGWQPDVVRSVAFAGDNESIAAACSDGAVRIWKAASGEWTEAIAPDPGGRPALSVAVHDSNIAVCGMMRELRLRGSQDKTSRDVCQLPPGGHDVVAWSRDGRQLAVAGRQGAIRIYRDAIYDAPAVEVPGKHQVNAIAFSRDGTTLAAVTDGQPLRLIRTDSGQAREISLPESDDAFCVAFTADDQQLVVGTQQGFLLIVGRTESTIQSRVKAHSGPVNSVAVFPDGGQIVTAGKDRRLLIWDTATAELVAQLWGHERGVLSVAISPDGTTLASSGIEGDVRIWRTSDPP